MRAIAVQPVSRELQNAVFGDRRLSRRLGQIAEAIERAPAASLPRACRTPAALEATYRLLSNPRVAPAQILAPHIAATVAHAAGTTPILVVHDTTEFGFAGTARAHLGRTNNSQPGFFAHVSLAIRQTELEPLGVVGCHTWARKTAPPSKAVRTSEAWRQRPGKESDRWSAAAIAVEDQVAGAASLVHVVDREGDQYRLMAQLCARHSGFIVRSHADRRLAADGTLHALLRTQTATLTRPVQLANRTPRHQRAAHGPRAARAALLGIAAAPVEICRAKIAANRGLPATLTVNAVRVFELQPPPDAEPVEWILLTTLPIATAEQLATIVDGYRARWLIEELFKAVKTGCMYEQLQLENERALHNALAIILPIAARMLLLRALSRSTEPTSAARVLTPTQLAVLGTTPWTKRLPLASARDALLAVARLGGHIKNNGDPGWEVLYRGFRDLLMLEIGWQAKSDQS